MNSSLGVRFAVDDAIHLLDHRAANGLRQMAFARPWWAEKERLLPYRDEAASSWISNRFICLRKGVNMDRAADWNDLTAELDEWAGEGRRDPLVA
jgi:hypothetical protein